MEKPVFFEKIQYTQIHAQVSSEDKQWVEEQASKWNTTRSEVLRWCIKVGQREIQNYSRSGKKENETKIED